MAATIKIKNSSTTGAVPTTGDLVQGELAINVTDLGIYTENASGTIVKLNAPSIDDKNTGATKRLTIDTSGNLGLGVVPSSWSSTLKPLEIGNIGTYIAGRPSGNQVDIGVNNYYNAGFKYANTGVAATLYEQSGGTHAWSYAGTGTAGNAITFIQAMTLDASGNLLVGQTSTGNQNSNSFDLDKQGGYFAQNHISGTSSGAGYTYFYYNASQIGSITQNGTTGVLYNLTSDYRLKNNPEALTGAKDFVMALQPKKWQWWDGSGEGVGFIAHEFMEVAKYSGGGEKDAVDENGNPVYQTISPSSSEVIANLVAHIQNLETRLAALEQA